jgi:hypothetical protein
MWVVSATQRRSGPLAVKSRSTSGVDLPIRGVSGTCSVVTSLVLDVPKSKDLRREKVWPLPPALERRRNATDPESQTGLTIEPSQFAKLRAVSTSISRLPTR